MPENRESNLFACSGFISPPGDGRSESSTLITTAALRFPLSRMQLLGFEILLSDHRGGSDQFQPAVVYPCYPGTHLLNRPQVVRNDKYRHASPSELLDPLLAFLLESPIADRKYLVHKQQIRIHIGRHGKRKPLRHSRRIVLERYVQKLLQLRKRNYIGKP